MTGPGPDVDDVVMRLVEEGAIEECEMHGYLVDNMDAAAVEVVEEELTAEVGKDRAKKLIQEALAQAAIDCIGCTTNADS